MTILGKILNIERTRDRAFDDFDRPSIVDLDSKRMECVAFDFQPVYKYRMTLTMGVEFQSNAAQYDRAEKVAIERCASFLFAPIHEKLSKLASKLSDGKKDECFLVIDEIRSLMKATK